LDKTKSDWEKVVEFHGHVCPGLAIGFKAAQEGLKALAGTRAVDEELVAIVENDACGVDAIQVLTGCTMGKGNLIFRDVGKHAFAFIVREKQEGVRVSLKHGKMENQEHRALMQKVISGKATAAEKAEFEKLHGQICQTILDTPGEELFDIATVKVELPQKAMVFKSVACAYCGEGVMEPRAMVKDGKPCCADCATHYRSKLLALD